MSYDLAQGPAFTDPFPWFQAWLKDAEDAGISDPNACAFATVSADGQPSARIVLLKEWDERGFVIYTNLTSNKGQEALGQGRASMTFFWRTLGRQVRIEGTITQVSDAQADAYFATRPRGSQVGAWASLQSTPLASRQELMDRAQAIETTYKGVDVPRPPHWSGLCLAPERIEFWQAGESRLHDRFEFMRPSHDSSWIVRRVYP